jgi:hypothetical protein
MNLDLNKLAHKIDNALVNETSETLNKWLNNKRTTTDKIKKNMKSLAKHEAFMNAIKTGQAKTKAQLVYLSLLQEPRTIEFFRTNLQMAHQSCTAAISKLEDAGWVYKLRTVRSGKNAFTLYAAETNLEDAKTRAEKMMEYKRQEWFKRGLKNGWIQTEVDSSLLESRNFGNEVQDKFQGD